MEFNILDTAITYGACRFIKYKLEESSSLITGQLNGPLLLYTALVSIPQRIDL